LYLKRYCLPFLSLTVHSHRDDLEALLLGINGAALSLLAIDPELNILNA